jgi:hypothetical protein
MNKMPIFAAGVEVVTGLALIVAPCFVARLLFGTDLTGVSIPVARVAGIGLLSLGIACWPTKQFTRLALCAMLTYDLLVTLYLLYLGIGGDWVGPLLWPAVVLHSLLTVLLVRLLSLDSSPKSQDS